MKPNRLNPLFAHLFSAGFAALIVVSASAAEISYKPTASSTNVGTLNTNWNGNVLPGAADSAYWKADSRDGTINFATPVTWGAIRAEDATGSITLSGSPITLAGLSAPLYGGASVVQGITEVRWENFVVGNNIALGSDQTWNIGNIATGAAGSPMTLNGTLSGAFNLTKVGAGTLNLTANNSGYTNTITSTAGTLNVAAIGGSLSVSGGTVNASGAIGGSVTAGAGTFTGLAGSSVVGGITTTGSATINLGGSVGGSVTLGPGDTLGLRGGSVMGNLTLDDTNLNVTNTVAVSGNIQVANNQTISLAVPTFGAPMTILSAGGTLSDTDDSNPSNNFTISNAITFRNAPVISTTSQLVQVTIAAGVAQTWTGSSGSPTLWNVGSAANWAGTGSFFFNGDAVTFDDTATPATPVAVAISGLLSPSSITFNNSSKAYNVTGAGSGNGITGATGLIKNGTGVLTLGGGGSTYIGNVQVNAGTLQIGDWEALGASGKTISVASGAALNLNGNRPSSSGRHYTWSIAGDGVAGSGALTNSGGASFNNAGIQTLQLTANASLGGTGRFDIGRSGNNFGTIEGNGFTLTKNGANEVVVRAPANNISYILNAGILSFEDSDTSSGSNAITINAGTVGSFGTRTFGNNLNFTAAGATLRSNGNVGTWNGNISLNGDVTFLADSLLVINGTVSGAGNITKSGGNELRIGNGGTVGSIGSRNVAISSGVFASNRSDAVTISGNISGVGSFSSLGLGTTTLTGNNTYAGVNRVLGGGTLVVNTVADSGGLGALGSFVSGNTRFLVIEGNSTLRITGTGNQTSSIPMFNGGGVGSGTIDVVDAAANITFTSAGGNVSGNLIKSGAGTLSLAEGFYNSAPVTVNTGKLVLSGPSLGLSNTQVAAGATLEIATGNSKTIAGAFSGSGSLVKSGAGALTLSSATSTFSGNTSVNAGTLVLADNATLGFTITNSSSNQISGTGVLTLDGDFVINRAAVTAGSGSWTLVNVATLTESFGPTFTVAGAGWTETANVWTLVDGPKTWTFTEATGILTVSSAASPYTTWIDGFTFAPGADKTPSGDPDADGLSNQQEFAFGLIPNSGSSVNPITVQLDKTAGTFTYNRRKPSLTGLTYKVWTSPDLSTWTEDATAVQSPTNAGDNQSVVVTLTGAPLSATKLFVRVAAN